MPTVADLAKNERGASIWLHSCSPRLSPGALPLYALQMADSDASEPEGDPLSLLPRTQGPNKSSPHTRDRPLTAYTLELPRHPPTCIRAVYLLICAPFVSIQHIFDSPATDATHNPPKHFIGDPHITPNETLYSHTNKRTHVTIYVFGSFCALSLIPIAPY